MVETPEDPRVLLERLEAAEKKSREYRGLAVAMSGPVSDSIRQMEVGNAPVPAPKKRGWLTFQYRRSYDTPLVTHTTLDETDKRRLRTALEVLADEEAQRARELAKQLGTKAKV